MWSRDTWKEIFEAIGKNKLRTFLTGFSVSVGIFFYIILSGMGTGLYNNFDNLYLEDALNIIRFTGTETSVPYGGYKAKRVIEFNNDDLKAIEQKFGHTLEYITPRITRRNLVTYQNNSDFYFTRGVASGHLIAENSLMMRGRYINEKDVAERTKYAVIGRMVEKDLFDGADAIGKHIDISGISFKVVGVFQDEGGDNEERFIYIPYSTRQLLEGNTDKLNVFIAAFPKSLGVTGAIEFQNQLTSFLKSRKTISPDDPWGFRVLNFTEQYQKTQLLSGAIQVMVLIISLSVIISGVIGVSNIMVFTIKERTKEIGIRKALGATPKMITSTIILESITITSVFGFTGLVLGVFILNNLQSERLHQEYLVLNPSINGYTALFVTVLLIACGAIAAYVPARRASKIKPIEALRDD
jgi:putative ABC transport system permease protein